MNLITSLGLKHDSPSASADGAPKTQPEHAHKTFGERKKEVDIYIETHIRNLGYADEVGESLRPILENSNNAFVRKLPDISYIPAATYMALDVADKYKKGEDGNGKNRLQLATREALYQGISSFALPMAIVVNCVHKFTQVASNVLPDAKKSAKDKVGDIIKGAASLDSYSSKVGTLPKLIAAGISIFALLKLSKPIDICMTKVFSLTVDRILGLNKKDKDAPKNADELSSINKTVLQKAEEQRGEVLRQLHEASIQAKENKEEQKEEQKAETSAPNPNEVKNTEKQV